MKNIQKSSLDIKKEKITSVTEKLGRTKSVFLTEYHGLTSEQLNELRSKIKEAGGELLVIKNTLLKLALAKQGKELSIEQLAGPTATLLAYNDELAPLKEVAESNKIFGLPSYKIGFLGHDILDAAAIETLAKLPGKQVLQGKVVGALISPIYGIAGVLNANLRNLVFALDQIREQKEGVN